MNTISAVTQTQVQNITPNSVRKQNNVNFTGNLGDKFVRQIMQGADVDPKAVISEAKGTFGLKSEKVEDIMESFIGKMKELFSEKMDLSRRLSESERQIQAFPEEKSRAVRDAEYRVSKNCGEVIAQKDKVIARKNREIADMKTQVEKYRQVVKLKSVEELDTIMPDKVVEILDEMVKNQIPARASMFDFLMSGKGQEEALKQIERNNQIQKARRDGILNIPDLASKLNDANLGLGIYTTKDSDFTIIMIEDALLSHKNGAYITSPVIKSQVKDNAMALLTPMAEENIGYNSLARIERELYRTMDKVEIFHKNFARGLNHIRKSNPNAEIEVKNVDFDLDNSKVLVKGKDDTREFNFWQISNFGNSTIF